MVSELRLGISSREKALSKVCSLARANPNSMTIASQAMNAFISVDAYSEMLTLIDELLVVAPPASAQLFFRNRAIGLQYTGGTPEMISEAFSRSMEVAMDAQLGISNAARPYVAYLLRNRRYDDARRVLQVALRADPLESQLLRQLGELESAEGHPDQARKCFERAIPLADNDAEREGAAAGLQRLDALEVLLADGLISADAPTTIRIRDVTAGPVVPNV